MRDSRTSFFNSIPALCGAAVIGVAAALALAAGCSQEAAAAMYPTADLRPPALVAAGPTGSRLVLVRFDEAVVPVAGSFVSEPPAELSCSVDGNDLLIAFASDQIAGATYALAGEVDDSGGNRARFLLKFAGWNDRAPPLRISEIQTGKNTSKTNPHRDFVELEVLSDGNVGGEELSWASSVKTATYRFPGIEVRKGDFIVLHLAPEGLPVECDELGADLSASGGIDASPTGRDLWCATMPLPDESGALAVSIRPGDPPIDGFFYADEAKTGPVGAGKLTVLLTSLSGGIWPFAGAAAAWEDAFKWKCSTAKSICRLDPSHGPLAWYVAASGTQTPGGPNAGPESATVAAKGKQLAVKAVPKKR